MDRWEDDRPRTPDGARKDDVVEPYRRRFRAGGATAGVVVVGVAQERGRGWRATKRVRGREVHFDYARPTVYVNHYYVYVIDAEWGPAFLKVCGYCPSTMKLWLNGHEWAKRQLTKRGIAFAALDNGFLTCAAPAVLQTVCASLGAADVQAFLARWLTRLPLPLTATDAAAGFAYRLSVLRMEVSRPQVFDRPLRGREFFEEVLRDNLDLGRPDRIQLLFERRVRRDTPSRFSTRVITQGVAPSLHVEDKRCHVKQYFKEGRALRTETTCNDPQDVGVKKGLSNFAFLRAVGQRIKGRLLTLERTAHDCGLAAARLSDVTQPPRTPHGQPAPALKLGDPRVVALLQALCLFALTPAGRRTALFLTKVHARVLRPGFQALDPQHLSQAPPRLRAALAAVDAATDALIAQAKLAA